MKKVISIILSTVMMLTISASVFAANGDIVGHIYSTDIRAYINDVEVESYNIGGKTAVVIEDILNEKAHPYVYNDNSRTLKFFSLSPYYLIEKKTENKAKPGKIIGNIYETDIKTSIYDVTIPTYNIGGKTAVAIEDLGYDGAFSPIGGKFVWNEKERTISLEFLYENTGAISKDKNINITFNEDMTEAMATFEEVLHCGGGSEHFTFPDYITDDANIEVVLPIKAEDKIIGYYFRRPSKDYKFTAFTYYYPEKLKEAEKNCIPDPHKTRENIISHFVTRHSGGEPRERFDAENYSFIYLSTAGTSWTAYNLLQVYDDGTYVDYKDEINTLNRSPQNLIIDKENEKVTFKYVDRYHSEWFTNYEIDLKTSTIKSIENNEEIISLSQLIDEKKEETTSVQVYVGAKNYEVDIEKFFEIADGCMITKSTNPHTIPYGGMYVGVIADGMLSSIYISNDGGIDFAVPAPSRQLNAVYTMNDISCVDKIKELIPVEVSNK